MTKDSANILRLFSFRKRVTRKELSQLTGYSDRRCRRLIQELVTNELPNEQGETIIFNRDHNVYELTNDLAKIEKEKHRLNSYIDDLSKRSRALDKAGKKGQTEIVL